MSLPLACVVEPAARPSGRLHAVACLSAFVLVACGGGGGGGDAASPPSAPAPAPAPSPAPSPAPGPAPAPAPSSDGGLFYIGAATLMRYDLGSKAEAKTSIDIESAELLGYGAGVFTELAQSSIGQPFYLTGRTYASNAFTSLGFLLSFSLLHGIVSGPIHPSPDGTLYTMRTIESAALGEPTYDYVQVMDSRINGKLRLRDYRDPVWLGNTRVVVSGDDGLFVINLATPTATPTRIGPRGLGLPAAVPGKPAVSPDGASIAFVQGDSLWRIGVDGTGLTRLTTSHIDLSWPAWSPDGTRIVVQRGACAVVGTTSPDPDAVVVSATTPSQDIDQAAPLMRSIDVPLRICGPRYWLP